MRRQNLAIGIFELEKEGGYAEIGIAGRLSQTGLPASYGRILRMA
jgi:hypothetical protein